MKITFTLFGLIGLVVIGLVLCLIFCTIDRTVDGYDLLIYSKNETPKRHVGIRYKDDFMIHVFTKETIGDGVDKLIELWKTRKDTKGETGEKA